MTNYSLYIDESGGFEDNKTVGKRASLIAGWVARNNLDHDSLRSTLLQWNAKMQHGKFHATEWRKRNSKTAEALLSGVFPLVSCQNAYAVVAIENRLAVSTQDDRQTYLDMLVELIAAVLMQIQNDGLASTALPLQVYLAERKGQTINEIDLLLKYRLRVLLAGCPDKRLVSGYNLHLRYLNFPAEALIKPESKLRLKDALFPELVLADFICNELYQRRTIKTVPKGLTNILWIPMLFEADPFWRDINLYRRERMWLKLVMELSSDNALKWLANHSRLQADFSEIYDGALRNCLATSTDELLQTIKTRLFAQRNWNQADRLMKKISKQCSSVPVHLIAKFKWECILLRWDIANHAGDHDSARSEYDRFRQLLTDNEYHRWEFIKDISEYYNRYAIALTDRHDFAAAEKVLDEAIEIERAFLKVQISVQGKMLTPRYSDSLGKLLSSKGQLYSKKSIRYQDCAFKSLELFDEAEVHLQSSFDFSRQRNYRVEVLLSSTENIEAISNAYSLLIGVNRDYKPDDLLKDIPVWSFDMLYWLRWMAVERTELGSAYRREVIGRYKTFDIVEPTGYPGTSILYWLGVIALQAEKNDIALSIWEKCADLDPTNLTGLGVLHALKIRSLCQLALRSAEPRVRLQKILADGKWNHGLSEYLDKYIQFARQGTLDRSHIISLINDIPYS